MPSLLLFAGLPHDVREPDLAELLTADPVRLTPSSVAVTALHDSAGAFLGTFLVQVGADADAEKVRRQFSGQVIDGTHTLAVHHVLQPTVPHPSVAPKAAVVVPKPVPAVKAAVAHVPRAAAQPKKKDTQPPGLKLLNRLGKGGKAGEKEKQKLLLEKQRAALRRGNPGDLLAARLGKAKPAVGAARGAAAKTKAAKGAKAAGSAKTARAKGAAARMDVDAAPAAPKKAPAKKDDKPRAKTQAELDEEMRAYERARRFA